MVSVCVCLCVCVCGLRVEGRESATVFWVQGIGKELRVEWPAATPRRRARQTTLRSERERDFLIDNLLVRIHLIIEMILVDRPFALGG